jgi:hypothetical protein
MNIYFLFPTLLFIFLLLMHKFLPAISREMSGVFKGRFNLHTCIHYISTIFTLLHLFLISSPFLLVPTPGRNYSSNGGRGDKGEWWRGWIQLWYIVRIFVNVTIYPQYNNNVKVKFKKKIKGGSRLVFLVILQQL